MKTVKRSLPIKRALLLIGLLPLVTLAICLNIFTAIKFVKEIKQETFNKLEVSAENVSTYFNYDLVYFGDVTYEDYADHSFIESVQKLDVETSLFKQNTCFLTSFKDSKGKYTEGTKAEAGIWETVSKGNLYTAENAVFNGTPYYVCYVPVYNTDGSVWGMGFAGTPQAGVKSLLNSTVTENILITAILLVAYAALIVFLSRKIYTSIHSSVDSLSKLATGELTVSTDNTSNISEIQQVIDATINLKEQLTESAGGAKTTAIDLDKAVESVDNLAQKSASETGSIARSMNELSVTAQSLAETVQNANSYVIDMGDAITSITEKAQGSASDAENMRNVNSQMAGVIENVKESNIKSVEAIRQIGVLTAECKEAVETIRTAAEEITGIAGQTNLLALNASIESARAGEAGRGFSVVAENIKNLAAESANSSAGISERVNEIILRVDKCVEAAQAAAEIMQEQNDLVTETGRSMDILSESVGNVADNISVITGEAERLDQAKIKVLNNISDLSAISEENAASSEQVSSSVAEVTNAIEGVKEEAGRMRDLATSLGEKMEYFKL